MSGTEDILSSTRVWTPSDVEGADLLGVIVPLDRPPEMSLDLYRGLLWLRLELLIERQELKVALEALRSLDADGEWIDWSVYDEDDLTPSLIAQMVVEHCLGLARAIDVCGVEDAIRAGRPIVEDPELAARLRDASDLFGWAEAIENLWQFGIVEAEGASPVIDNIAANTMASGLARRAASIVGDRPHEVCIATGFFNLGGFRLIAPALAGAERVRLLLGAEPKPEAELPARMPGDPTEPGFTSRLVQQAIASQEQGLSRDRDMLPFDRATDGALRSLLESLHSGRIEVRRVVDRFLHAKAYLFRPTDERAGRANIVGSSNLTYSGLRGSLELNIVHEEPPITEPVEGWFDELWEAAPPYDLAAVFDRLMQEFPPHLIFLRVLFELYGAELAEEEKEVGDTGLSLTGFQEHGAWRAIRIMRKCGGVLVADGVGLGKTFIAGRVMELYRRRRQRVLLLCPAALRDSTWRHFLNEHQLMVECLSYEQLARDGKLGGDQNHLINDLSDYALVVIDEAHNYRNPDSKARAAVLRRLLLGERRDVLMLSATPVNNSLWDLYHLLRYFIKQDAIFADRGVLSIRDRFVEAMRMDPFELHPDQLFPIIDATTVKRTRKFIKKHYENETIRYPDGRILPIRFPTPVARTIRYELDDVLPGFFEEVEEALAPEDGLPLLTLARYQPERYRRDADPDDVDTAIVGLIRSGLLKRFESSSYAFAQTLGRMIAEHDLFLRGLDQGRVALKALFRELPGGDDEEAFEELLEAADATEPVSQYDEPRLRAAVEADRATLEALRARAASVTIDQDPKLAALADELARVVQLAEEEGLDDADKSQRRKVLLFSAFADTIDWIEGYLDRALEHDPRLRRYFGRTASVGGRESRGGLTRDDVVFGFSPGSAGAPAGRDADRFDLVLSTDVLAEGMNLQQCGNIINYDLPWNPMRLVQRHGRIDRIGSRYTRVHLRTFFPDARLDDLLDLEQRVRRKLAQAAASVGVETAPIEGGAERDASFAETVEEIEKLRQEDASLFEAGGVESATQSGEEYRQVLRKGLEAQRDAIVDLPWKAGSGMRKGDRTGHFFCVRVGERVFLRFVPSDGGEIVHELGTCLRLIECEERTPREMPEDLRLAAFDAWETAKRHVLAAWNHLSEPMNLQPTVPPLNREIAEHLRAHPPEGFSVAAVDAAIEAVEAPCSMRERNALREVFKRSGLRGVPLSGAIAQEIKRLGLEPFKAPDPLPPITESEVHLVCWMAVIAEGERPGAPRRPAAPAAARG